MKGSRLSKLQCLVAYPYINNGIIKFLKDNEKSVQFVLDSGAFTAWKAGKTITLDEYCNAIQKLPFEPWRYFTLDVVGDAHATLKNYELMLKRGFKPVPIFTRGESPAVIEDYYKTSDLVGIGGLVGTEKNKGFVKGIMRLAAGRKVHLLGFTNILYLKALKPYMCDSSSWEMGARYARVQVYMGGGRIKNYGKTDFKTDRIDFDTETAIRRLGFDPHLLRDDKNWAGGYSTSRRLGASSMVRLQLEIQKKVGTKLFLAATTDYALRICLEEFQKHKGDFQ